MTKHINGRIHLTERITVSAYIKLQLAITFTKKTTISLPLVNGYNYLLHTYGAVK